MASGEAKIVCDVTVYVCHLFCGVSAILLLDQLVRRAQLLVSFAPSTSSSTHRSNSRACAMDSWPDFWRHHQMLAAQTATRSSIAPPSSCAASACVDALLPSLMKQLASNTRSRRANDDYAFEVVEARRPPPPRDTLVCAEPHLDDEGPSMRSTTIKF